MHRVTTEGDIGQRVAIAAKSYEGAPYVAIAGQDSTMAVGLSPDHGFNCSGLVIRSVLDGYGLTLDSWARSMQVMSLAGLMVTTKP